VKFLVTALAQMFFFLSKWASLLKLKDFTAVRMLCSLGFLKAMVSKIGLHNQESKGENNAPVL
jgi:hypothetical protein